MTPTKLEKPDLRLKRTFSLYYQDFFFFFVITKTRTPLCLLSLPLNKSQYSELSPLLSWDQEFGCEECATESRTKGWMSPQRMMWEGPWDDKRCPAERKGALGRGHGQAWFLPMLWHYIFPPSQNCRAASSWAPGWCPRPSAAVPSPLQPSSRRSGDHQDARRPGKDARACQESCWHLATCLQAEISPQAPLVAVCFPLCS